MQTRSSLRLVSNPSSNPTPSTNLSPKGRNRRRSKQRIKEFNLDELYPPIVTMTDQRTMAQLLQAPTEGYENAIVVPTITADNFELKHELHQLDTFYNALNSKDQDSLNSTAGGNFLDKMPRECLAIIESKSKVCYLRNKPIVAKVSTNTSTSNISPNVAELKDMVKALLIDKKSQNQAPAPVKAVEESYVTCGGALSYRNFPTTDGNVYRDNIQEFVSQASAFVNSNSATTSSSGTLPSNTIANSRSDLKAITTQSGVSYDRPQIPPLPSFLPNVVENEPDATKETVNPTNNGSTEDIFKDMSFEISFADALILIPKFALTLKALIKNKEKLSEMARTPLNEHCSAVLLKKLPEKLGDPGKFLIPCDFPELADSSISCPVGVAEDVYVKVGSFPFTVDFVVVDLDVDPRVPLILGISFLKTEKALIDVFEANYNDMTAKRIDVIDMACEEHSQEVLGFSDIIISGNPTPFYDLIVSTTFPTLTPFENSDFLLKEVDAFLAIGDDPTSPKFYHPYLDPEGDLLLLEAFLNNDPSLPPSNQGNYLPEVRKELKICEAESDKSSIDEPLEVELKDLPPHLEYAFLEGDYKFLVIIAKDLSVEEKTALKTVLKSHKRAIAWKLSDIKGINPEFCTHKILMEEEFEPTVQHQRRVNPKIYDVIKQEVIKLLEAGLIYPIFDSPWVSPVQCVPKKGGFMVVANEDNELIPTRLVTGCRVCIDYHKLNEATRKDHFPLPFMDQMLERLAGNQYYCFLEGTFQRCMMAIFHDMIEKTIEVFMDEFSVFENSFQSCLSYLERMLKRCEDTNLCLNWEKSHFMVKEGIVLGHKISKQGIDVDKAKVDVITKLPHLTTVKGIRSFLGHAGFYRRKLTEAPILIAPDWDMPFELMCNASDFAIGAVLGKRQDKHFRPIHYASKTMTEAESNYTTTEKEMLAVVCTLYKVVYKKAYHLPIELEHKAYWALKHANFDLKTADDHRKVQINELNELHYQAYENTLIYMKKTKRLYDSKIKNRVFNIDDRVLLFNS
uniref:Retrovirus-related Pol polyprotein from transposon 17.6 n=1 Tax=Tanacetum cinerariifolium TaxID=118510 RepID=A0A6L2MVQ2_TANCI|nr:retrovirus-related Pol polyprotein from transposon 17.6 [Tanacetum cinerariifolium]